MKAISTHALNVGLIVRDCSEAERADPEHPDTICISAQDLTEIVSRHTPRAVPDGWQHVLVSNVADVEEPDLAECSHQALVAEKNTSDLPADVVRDAERYHYLTRTFGKYCVTDAYENTSGVLKAGAADQLIDADRLQRKDWYGTDL